MIILYLLIFVIACYILAISGTVLVKVLTALSRYFRITEYVFAFILMTFDARIFCGSYRSHKG